MSFPIETQINQNTKIFDMGAGPEITIFAWSDMMSEANQFGSDMSDCILAKLVGHVQRVIVF